MEYGVPTRAQPVWGNSAPGERSLTVAALPIRDTRSRAATVTAWRRRRWNPSMNLWPALPLDEWLPTYATLHRWTQIVGKTRLALAPFQNHWWNATLYVTARGLHTSPMPYRDGALGSRSATGVSAVNLLMTGEPQTRQKPRKMPGVDS